MKDLHIAQVESLYSDHHGWLRGWLRSKLGCTEQAADLAHDTFLRVVGTRDILSRVSEPRAYLVTTAKHLLIDRSRRQKIEQAYLEKLAERQDEANVPSPESILQAVQAIEELGNALRSLHPQTIEAFTLHYLHNQDQNEIAMHFGVSLRTVQTWLAQALVQCHRAIGSA